MRTMVGILATTLYLAGMALAVDDPDNLMQGKVTVIKTGKLAKFAATPSASLPMPSDANAPTGGGGTLRIFDTGQVSNGDSYTLAASGWSRIPKNDAKPLKGYKFKGEPCKSVIVKTNVVKANCKGAAIQLDTPFTANVGIVLTLGTSSKRYCASFGGTGKNDAKQVKRKGAPAPAACPAPLLPTTTSLAATTSTSLRPTTSVTIRSTTSTSETSTTSSTETSTTQTSTTSNTEPTVPTTSTSSTTSTTIGGCCNSAGFLNFKTVDAPGDCGDVLSTAGALVTNINCAGLYTGGGGNSVPLPYDVPDLGSAVSAITSCTGQTATVGGTTSTETGSAYNCTNPGCFFGAPLAVPNPGTTATSVCVVNTASSAPSGTVDCGTGATTVNLPLSSILFLTGDTATDPGSSIPGTQPCPLCSAGSCVGGANNGMSCTAGTTTLGGNPAYPTSNDCPPAGTFNIGTLPVAFTLSTGTVTWSGTQATNDTGSTAGNQARNFAGYCRDADGSLCFKGDPDTACPASSPGFQECWRNGMAVGAACSGIFESCVQRNGGAFGPAGGNNRTITAIGSAASIVGGPAAGTLVSVFSIAPTFNATVDAAGDLPGPGAVALPGTATLCADAMSCP